jgi:hypothetical protein
LIRQLVLECVVASGEGMKGDVPGFLQCLPIAKGDSGVKSGEGDGAAHLIDVSPCHVDDDLVGCVPLCDRNASVVTGGSGRASVLQSQRSALIDQALIDPPAPDHLQA